MRVQLPSRPPMEKITYHPKELQAVLEELETSESRSSKIMLTVYYELVEKLEEAIGK